MSLLEKLDKALEKSDLEIALDKIIPIPRPVTVIEFEALTREEEADDKYGSVKSDNEDLYDHDNDPE